MRDCQGLRHLAPGDSTDAHRTPLVDNRPTSLHPTWLNVYANASEAAVTPEFAHALLMKMANGLS
eukprot:6303936-Pyramimonas_sp.AAC.1